MSGTYGTAISEIFPPAGEVFGGRPSALGARRALRRKGAAPALRVTRHATRPYAAQVIDDLVERQT